VSQRRTASIANDAVHCVHRILQFFPVVSSPAACSIAVSVSTGRRTVIARWMSAVRSRWWSSR